MSKNSPKQNYTQLMEWMKLFKPAPEVTETKRTPQRAVRTIKY